MDRQTTRRAVLATAAVSIAGCLGDTLGSSDPEGQPSDATLPTADEQLPIEYDLAALRGEIVDGGVPQDGIPSIDDPAFEPVDEVGDRLDDGDPVFGVTHDGEARAYPQSILVRHEIVNDTIGETPIAVTYCPLTGTAMGFERGEVEFGVSGELLNSNLVMYDRRAESRWPQMLATAIDGPDTRSSLRELPVFWSRWEQWRSAYPESQVLTEETGHIRDYDDDPYGSYNPRGGYYEDDSSTIFEPLAEDDRAPAKRMVVGARPPAAAQPFAIDRERLRDDGLVAFEHGGTPVLAVHDDDTGAHYCYWNPEETTYTIEDGALVDDDGASHSLDEPGPPLDPIYAYDAMWFAWMGFYPSSEYYQ